MKLYTFVVPSAGCVKFHKNSISSLIGVVLTRYMPPLFISPFKFWTATIFLHAHLQVVYYKCVKFHKNPISPLGGVALTTKLLIEFLSNFTQL
jgi:hypothetical protein